jgi:uncharacterized delta-60 repeat protein
LRNKPMLRKTTRNLLSLLSRAGLVLGLLLSVSPLLAAPSDLDPTWGGDGVVEIDFDGDGVADGGYALQAQSTRDGKYLVLAADQNRELALLRYLPDGTPDPQFGQGGVAYMPEPPDDAWTDIYYGSFVVQSDGKIVVTGIVQDTTASRGTPFIRFNADGSLDTTYGTQGVVILPPSAVIIRQTTGGQVVLPQIAILSDDKILLTGYGIADEPEYDEFGPFVMRVTPDGQLDTSFSGDGIIRLTNPGGVPSLALQPDGGALVAAGAFEGVGIVRLNAAGVIDTSYGENGLASFSPSLAEMGIMEESVYLNDIALLPGEGLFLTGIYYATDPGMPSGSLMAMLNAGGDLSSSFDGNGVRMFPYRYDGSETYFWATVQANQKVLVAYDGDEGFDTIYGLARVGLDGQFDPTWNGTGLLTIDDYDFLIAPAAVVDASGRILSALGGRIRRFMGDPAFGYVTLSPRHRQPHIAPSANLSLTFAGPVTINAGDIEIRRVSDYALHERIPVTDAARVSGSGTATITINPSADFAPNTRYFVIVHPNSFVNPSGHPFSGVNELTEWHFTTGQSAPVNLLLNRGFEGTGATAKRAAKWPAKRLVATDGRICNQTPQGAPPKIYAHGGKCAFRFKHNAVHGRNIEQIVTFTDALAGEVLAIEAYVRRNALTDGAMIQVQLTYSDAKTQIVNLPIPRGTQPYRLIAKTFTLPKDAVKARVRVMTGKSKGTLLVDDLSLTVGAAGAPPVDLPAGPDLRGTGQ